MIVSSHEGAPQHEPSCISSQSNQQLFTCQLPVIVKFPVIVHFTMTIIKTQYHTMPKKKICPQIFNMINREKAAINQLRDELMQHIKSETPQLQYTVEFQAPHLCTVTVVLVLGTITADDTLHGYSGLLIPGTITVTGACTVIVRGGARHHRCASCWSCLCCPYNCRITWEMSIYLVSCTRPLIQSVFTATI